ncbi:hypothetical protein [Sphaerisporangium dianthi]|uniref:Uncharacterized protein n=1 Tax=Sphaerisporangium dianthi TaxID=1436120 RepID=A0ABV9CLS9_9ACTN
MPADESARSRRAWAAAIPAQVAVSGAVVYLLDRTAIRSAADHVLRTLDVIDAAGTRRLAEGTRDELARYAEQATADTRPVLYFFLLATGLFTGVCVLLWRASPRATAAGLMLFGALTPPYLAGLAFVALTDLTTELWAGRSSEAGDLLENAMHGWYAPAHAAVLGAAAMAYVVTVFTLARPATTGRRTTPAPWAAQVIMLQLPLAGAIVAVLNFVAIGEAGRAAREIASGPRAAEYAGAGDSYIGPVTGAAWTYAALFAAAGAVMLVLAAIAWRTGLSAPLLVAHGVAWPAYLLLLVAASAASPFILSGAGGEPFPEVLHSGPAWYPPAIVTLSSIAAVAAIAVQVMLVRSSAARGRARRRCSGPFSRSASPRE